MCGKTGKWGKFSFIFQRVVILLGITFVVWFAKEIRKIRYMRSTSSVYWVIALSYTSRLSLYGLSKLALPHTGNRALTHDLARIRRGERTAPRAMVMLFDRLIPGSGAVANSFFWGVLDERRITRPILTGLIARLPLHLREQIAYLDRAGRPIKRKKISEPPQIEAIARVSTLDALGVLSLLAMELQSAMNTASKAALSRHYALYKEIVWASDFLIARLAIFSPFQIYAEKFREFIFGLVFRCPLIVEIEKHVEDDLVLPSELYNCGQDFWTITRTGCLLLSRQAYFGVTYSSDQEALQYVYEQLSSLSRLPVAEFERQTDFHWDNGSIYCLYDAR